MKKLALAALAATTLFTSPAAAADGFYVGIEGGLLWARNQAIDFEYDDDIFGPGPIPLGGQTSAAAAPAAVLEGLFHVDHDSGRDLDVIAGYDWGWVRTEIELANKRAGHDSYSFFLAGEPIKGDGHTRVNSAMLNVLLDVNVSPTVSLYAGPGIGIANEKMILEADDEGGELFTLKDTGLGVQAIAGVRFAVTPNIDLGVKYRYFEATGIEDSAGDGDEDFCFTGENCTYKTGFRSHSVLATLAYNFGAPVAPAPMPMAEPAPMPEPAPATQTCYDGSVVLATDSCPLPPAPPAPEPTPERG